MWVRTEAGTSRFAAGDVRTAGSSYVNFNVPASQRSVLAGINTGHRFVLALTRPAPHGAGTNNHHHHDHNAHHHYHDDYDGTAHHHVHHYYDYDGTAHHYYDDYDVAAQFGGDG